MSDSQDSAGISKRKSKVENALINIDRTLSRFGDASFGPQEQYGDDNDSHVQTNDKNASLVRTFAPPGLEESFQQLYSILYPCLCSKESSTGSAILMGPRGSGKSLLLERVLQACQRFSPQGEVLNYRKVSINGIVIRGEDVPSVIFEIIRQLSDIALQESSRHLPSNPPSSSQDQAPLGAEPNSGDNAKSSSTVHTTTPQETLPTTNGEKDNTDHSVVLTKRRRMEKYLLRVRQSSFTSNLSLLEATLKISEADQIPILLILDELDSFTDEGERQLLLYHLLDRVATPGSNLCLVGLTSSFTAMSILEKRIRSRAEGSSKVIYVRPPSSYEALLQVLGHKLEGCHVQTQVLDLLTPPSVGGTNGTSSQGNGETTKTVNKDDSGSSSSSSSSNESRLIVKCMERQFRLGKDLRWFSRVLSCALCMYRYDLVAFRGRAASQSQEESPLPPFRANHLLQSLLAMGASLEDDGTCSDLSSSSSSTKIASEPRMQALLDLSTPQVTLLLCARRLLAKDAHREELAIPLTIQRIFKEYESYRGGGKSNKQRLLHWPAVWQLLERGVLVPAWDHSGGGSLQYHAPISYKSMDPETLSRLPLHLPMEVDHEFGKALKENLLDCSTALSEWGRKTN